jgi:uncharacterized paraquat-inducible protein A
VRHSPPARLTEEEHLAYLNCPTCRMTVYTSTATLSEECPRCRAKLGKASRLFRSALPPRLLDPSLGDAGKAGRSKPA